MVEENVSEEFRLKNLDETRHFSLEGKEKNEWMTMKHKKVCKTLN